MTNKERQEIDTAARLAYEAKKSLQDNPYPLEDKERNKAWENYFMDYHDFVLEQDFQERFSNGEW